MNKVISIDDFKSKKIENQNEELTKAGTSFRERFSVALKDMEKKYQEEVKNANLPNLIKTKINISNVVKKAKASPLAAYSDLHKEFVENEIKLAQERCEKIFINKFPNNNKVTIESLQKKLVEEKYKHKEEISKLASQKMTEYLQLKDKA
jgi:hypothetical protein